MGAYEEDARTRARDMLAGVLLEPARISAAGIGPSEERFLEGRSQLQEVGSADKAEAWVRDALAALKATGFAKTSGAGGLPVDLSQVDLSSVEPSPVDPG